MIIILSLLILVNGYIKNYNPILLFPGLGGSRLIKNNIDIWPPKIKYFLFNNAKWKKEITIEYNNKELIYDTNVKTMEFGNIKSLDLHSNIPYIIRKNFYDNILSEYESIYPIPYDFRLIHDNNYRENINKKITDYIESFDKPVIFLCHSSGGIVGHHFLLSKSDEWKKKYIEKVINVNVPFGGLLIPLEECIINSFTNFILTKKLLKSIGAMILNFPNKNHFETILIVDGKKIDNYFNFFNLNNEEELYNNNLEIINSLVEPNNVNTIIVYTSDKPTPQLITINKNKIKIIRGPGDGIVPLNSLLVPKKWNQTNLEFIHLPNFEHSNIFFSDQLINVITPRSPKNDF